MIYSYPSGSSEGTPGVLNGFQLSGPGEVSFDRVKPLLAVSHSLYPLEAQLKMVIVPNGLRRERSMQDLYSRR